MKDKLSKCEYNLQTKYLLGWENMSARKLLTDIFLVRIGESVYKNAAYGHFIHQN